jgi:hypothetical protein
VSRMSQAKPFATPATSPTSSPMAAAAPGPVTRLWSDAGQATAEYALVLLGAAAVALLLIGWATTTDQVGRLFDFVVEQVIGRSR